MTPTVVDPSLYYLFRSGELIGINGSYIDDLLRGGNNESESIIHVTLGRFETSGNEDTPPTFAGININSTPEDSYAIYPLSYIDRPTQLRMDSTFKEFSSMRMRLAWLCNTRPDPLYEIS